VRHQPNAERRLCPSRDPARQYGAGVERMSPIRSVARTTGGHVVDIAVIGTGFVGGILGRALADSGHQVTFGSRHPGDEGVGVGTAATVASIADALARAEVVILALPGAAVPELTAAHRDALDGKLIIDATNQMGRPVTNSRAALPPSVRYARAFNTLGGENLADPIFTDGPADMFFAAPAADRATVETVIEAVGLRPIFLGEDQEELVDALFQIWIALAVKQGHGRRLALRLIDH
jgi:8-hydroxy-5-deazaflavin:NADPH oxidoreductase